MVFVVAAVAVRKRSWIDCIQVPMTMMDVEVVTTFDQNLDYCDWSVAHFAPMMYDDEEEVEYTSGECYGVVNTD